MARGTLSSMKNIIEMGRTSKDQKQIVDEKDAYLAIDGIESSEENRIPLWLFGFLY